MSLATLNIPSLRHGGQFYMQLSVVETTVGSKSYTVPVTCEHNRKQETKRRFSDKQLIV